MRSAIEPEAVALNRDRLAQAIGARAGVPAPGARHARGARLGRRRGAAAHRGRRRVTTEPGVACTVQVADCLPVLLAAPDGRGRRRRACRLARPGRRRGRGGVAGAVRGGRLRAGRRAAPGSAPCIGPRRFEVGADVLDAFGGRRSMPCRRRRRPRRAGKWLADLAGLARDRLPRAGVGSVSGGALVHRRGPRHGSSRSGATASPAAWPPPSGCAADAAAPRAPRARAAPACHQVQHERQRQHAVQQEREERAEHRAVRGSSPRRPPSARRRRARPSRPANVLPWLGSAS